MADVGTAGVAGAAEAGDVISSPAKSSNAEEADLCLFSEFDAAACAKKGLWDCVWFMCLGGEEISSLLWTTHRPWPRGTHGSLSPQLLSTDAPSISILCDDHE